MNRTFFWKLAAIFALAGGEMICAQASKPLPNAITGPQLIAIGSPLTFGGTNDPDTYSAATTFSSTPVLVDNGAVKIWQDQVPTSSTSEWDIFHMETVNGGPLANNINSSWAVIMTYTLTAAASFDAVATQFAVSGTPVSPLTNIAPAGGGDGVCCATASNPILPGEVYYNSGFNGAIPAGVVSNWQEIYLQPYSSEAASGSIDASTVNQLTFALHFTLQPSAPTITGVISASAFGAFPTFGPGSWIEIYGTNLGVGPQSWSSANFNGVDAPTTLVGSSVTINGQSAFVDYVSATQMNAQVPGVGTGPQSLVVTTATGTPNPQSSAPFTVNLVADNPGLLAPSSFKIGGTQYAVALFTDGAYVLPTGAIPGITSRPAVPGDTITLYGVGFGPVVQLTPPGQLAQGQSQLALPFTLSIGGTSVGAPPYAGLAPDFVGLYQFNVVVPSVGAGNAVPLTFTLGGVTGTQTLALAVGN